MEALLRLSGVLSEEDGNEPDLATLEQRLAARTSENGSPLNALGLDRPLSRQASAQATGSGVNSPVIKSQDEAPPRSSLEDVHEKDKKKNAEQVPDVESLADMMDSLVTNNHGETRYIGKSSP